MGGNFRGHSEERALRRYEADVLVLCTPLSVGHRGSDRVLAAAARLSNLASYDLPDADGLDPLFLLLGTWDRLRTSSQLRVVQIATRILALSLPQPTFSAESVRNWARYHAVRSWSRRPEIYFEPTDETDFHRGRCGVRFEHRDADDYADLMVACLQRMHELDKSVGAVHLARSEAEFLSSAGFDASAKLRAFADRLQDLEVRPPGSSRSRRRPDQVPEGWISVPDAMDRYNVSNSTLTDWISNERIPRSAVRKDEHTGVRVVEIEPLERLLSQLSRLPPGI